MTINPRSRTGAKTALRVPTTTWTSPCRMRCHSSNRSPDGEGAVHHGDFVAELVIKARGHLRRQRNFRHQHNHAAFR